MSENPVYVKNLLGPLGKNSWLPLVASVHMTAPFLTLPQSPKPWDADVKP